MRRASEGFTLAEVAVTVLIVGIVLVMAMQGLNNSMAQAGHTRNIKVARELGLFTLGQLESGLYMDDIEDHMEGDYADQDHADFSWELVLGDEPFAEEDELQNKAFDSWAKPDDEEDEADSTEPWVVARIKVRFPAPSSRQSDIVLERWLTRTFVFGEEEAEEGANR